MKQMRGMYFHGILLEQYVRTGAFQRLSWWLDKDLSFELAALAMIVLSDNETATLYQGVVRDQLDGSEEGHSWVEYRRGISWWVVDFSCGYPCEFLRSDYFGGKGGRKNLSPVWKCNYNNFWKINLADLIWVSLHSKEFSYVMRELTGFRPSVYHPEHAFEEWVLGAKRLMYDGTRMDPFCINIKNPRRPISTEIIQEFAKKRERRQPKMRTLRKTMKEVKQIK